MFNSEQGSGEIAIYNATFIFALIPNVNWITFNFDLDEYTITKDDIQNFYSQGLSKIQNKDELIYLIQENLDEKSKIKEFFHNSSPH